LSVASITKTPATVDREQAMRVYDIDIDDTETANNAQTPKCALLALFVPTEYSVERAA
jgi:hypothetical protein